MPRTLPATALLLASLLASVSAAAPATHPAALPDPGPWGNTVDALPDFSRSLKLHGDWAFKYVKGSDAAADEKFLEPAFDASGWAKIRVPGHWELQGFAEPKYKKADEGLGLYRRTFTVPGSFDGGRVMLRFDGALYSMRVRVNGKEAGQWASGYNPATFDITDLLVPGENTLAVRVSTRGRGYALDNNDDWSISGIYRDVTLFAVPAQHLTGLKTRTTLAPDGAAALTVRADASGGDRVRATLRDAGGTAVATTDLAPGAEGRFDVPAPKLWTAETPHLYTLDLELLAGGAVVQKHSERVGLRDVKVAQGVLTLNGRPIKLRGVNHHDLWPEQGRVIDDAGMRRELELMRDANVNFIRTSHYPPNRRLLELADEMGFYVMCELPYGHGDENLRDPAMLDLVLARARATALRDRNHPSVILWSVGNENPITPGAIEAAKLLLTLDGSRPMCLPTVGSHFNANLQRFKELPGFLDVFSPHYPSTSRVIEYARTLDRPVLFTEYAHQLGLASDRVQEQWEILRKNDRLAGGAVWMFQDQGILRTADDPAKVKDASKYVWLDDKRYYDTAGTDGMDGVVYADRTPSADYWQLRKVYTPVAIRERTAPANADVRLTVENRFDFRTLAGFKAKWALVVNGKTLDTGQAPLSAPARGEEPLTLRPNWPALAPGDAAWIALELLDDTGRRFHERSVLLTHEGTPSRADVLRAELAPAALTLDDSDAAVSVRHPRGTLRVDKASGRTTLTAPDGSVLVDDVGPHTGRRFTEAEVLRDARRPVWSGDLLRPAGRPEVTVSREGDAVAVNIKAKYDRPGVQGQGLDGEHRFTVKPTGEIDVTYRFAFVDATGTLVEAGLTLRAPASRDQLRWVGPGPYPSFPGKDALNEFGLHHLGAGDLHFNGNRREVELAALTDPAGVGLLLLNDARDVAVQPGPDGILLRHNVLVAGRGNKGSAPELQFDADELRDLRGRFSLLPLTTPWPARMTLWFGTPSRAPEFKPFLRSYDQ